MTEDMPSVYEAAGEIEGLVRLAAAWHAQVMADEIVSHAFSHGYHPEHTERLAAYWAEALGGPASYSQTCGDQSFVVRIHSGNGVHEEMDRRAIAWATTTAMSRYPGSADDVPDGMDIPRWSWQGLSRA